MAERGASSGGRLRIGLLTHSVNPRGGVVHTLELARALREAGHEPTVFAPATAGQAYFRDSGCEQLRVPVGRAPRGVHDMVVSRVAAFVDYLAVWPGRASIDVWHCHDGIGGNALQTLAERGAVGPWARTVHHLDHFDDRRVAALQDRGWQGAAAVYCVSRHWCGLLRESHGIEASLVGNGVDTRRFRPGAASGDAAACARLGLAPHQRIVLAVGGVESRKNTLGLLHAFARLRRTAGEAGGTHTGELPRLVIAGGVSLLDHDAYLRAFGEAAQAHGLEVATTRCGRAPILLTGAVADADMPVLLRRADVLAMPSFVEGFGLVALEALASGTPVVASRIAPFTEHLDDRLVDWADPHDAASIAHALRAALERGRSDAVGPAAQALLERYSWGASAARHVALYRQLDGAAAAVPHRPLIPQTHAAFDARPHA